jgi:ABC-2 type transport system ATP-binding protein
MSAAIFVKDLSKSYDGKQVVKGISFEVKPGEVFGFLGPNGAGKTTSIKMMIGELARDSGEIAIYGMKIPEDREEAKKIMGVVPDYQNLYDRLTVRQNLETFARLYEVPFSRVDELIKLVNLEEHALLPTQKLSRGLRQRTLIARGLLHSPRVFFLDEPTSALDPHSSLGIRKLIRHLQDQGTTVFITTHYMEEADQLCDRIAIMHRGQITAVDTPEALKRQHGRPTISITLKPLPDGDAEEIREIPLQGDPGPELSAALKAGRVVKIHSQEATLEKVFLQLTGDYWKDQEEASPEQPS